MYVGMLGQCEDMWQVEVRSSLLLIIHPQKSWTDDDEWLMMAK